MTEWHNGNRSPEATAELEHIAGACAAYDGYRSDAGFDSSFNFDKELDNILLLRDGKTDEAVGFVFLFVPTSAEAELTCCVLPAHRRQGLFKQMLCEVYTRLESLSIRRVLFVCDARFSPAAEVARRLGAKKEFTEYSLLLNPALFRPVRLNPLVLASPSAGDITRLAEMSALIFDEPPEDALAMMRSSIKSENRVLYEAWLNGVSVGFGGAFRGPEETTVFGFGMLPHRRGQGLGRAFLSLLLELLLPEGKPVVLDVNSVNEAACRLYRSAGFETRSACDYYAKLLP